MQIENTGTEPKTLSLSTAHLCFIAIKTDVLNVSINFFLFAFCYLYFKHYNLESRTHTIRWRF